jgi:hypothetical protein
MTKLLNNFNFIRTTFIIAIIFGDVSLCFLFLADVPAAYRWIGIPTTLITALLLIPVFRATWLRDDFTENTKDKENKK